MIAIRSSSLAFQTRQQQIQAKGELGICLISGQRIGYLYHMGECFAREGRLALTLPQIGTIVSLFNGLIFLLNGTLIPLEWYPTWAQTLARFLPTTLGIQVTDKVVLQQQSLAAVWADGTLPWLLLYTGGLTLLGWLVFLLCDQRTMRLGVSR